jgi:hypothetical protein
MVKGTGSAGDDRAGLGSLPAGHEGPRHDPLPLSVFGPAWGPWIATLDRWHHL